MKRILPILGFISMLVAMVLTAQAAPNDDCLESPNEAGNFAQSSDSVCIDCHTNEGLLQELAEEEILPAPPSEGSG